MTDGTVSETATPYAALPMIVVKSSALRSGENLDTKPESGVPVRGLRSGVKAGAPGKLVDVVDPLR